MSSKERGPQLFTVDEANRLLPKVRNFLSQLRQQRDTVLQLEQKKAVEELSWLKEDGSVDPKAHKEVARFEKQIEEVAHLFERTIEELNALGVQLKDLEEGLIDFFTAREDSLVYLCWKEGEERIGYWHDLESGFAGRRPLEDFHEDQR